MSKRLLSLILLGFVAISLAGCMKTQADVIDDCVKAMHQANGPYKTIQDDRDELAASYINCLRASSGK